MTEAEKLLAQAKEKGLFQKNAKKEKVIASTEKKKQEAAKATSFSASPRVETVKDTGLNGLGWLASGTSPRVEVVKDTGADDALRTIGEGLKKNKAIRQEMKAIGKSIRESGATDFATSQKAAQRMAELQKQLPMASFTAGLLDSMGGDVAKISAKISRNDAYQESVNDTMALLKQTRESNPTWGAAGALTGEFAKAGAGYATIGGAAEKAVLKHADILGLTGTKARAAAALLAQQTADTAVNTPITMLAGMADGKTTEEISKDVGKQIAMDAAFNAGLGALGNGYKYLKTARQSKLAEGLQRGREEVFTEALKKAGGKRAAEEATEKAKRRIADIKEGQASRQEAVNEWLHTAQPLALPPHRMYVDTQGMVRDEFPLPSASAAANDYAVFNGKQVLERAGEAQQLPVAKAESTDSYLELIKNLKGKKVLPRAGEYVKVISEPVERTIKKEGYQVPDAKTPPANGRTALELPSVNNTIAETAAKVNGTGQKVLPKAGEIQKAEGTAVPEVQAVDVAAKEPSGKEQTMQKIADAMTELFDPGERKLTQEEKDALEETLINLQDSEYIMEQLQKVSAETKGDTAAIMREKNRLTKEKKRIERILAEQTVFRNEGDILKKAEDEIRTLFGLEETPEEVKTALQKAAKNGFISKTDKERLFDVLFEQKTRDIKPMPALQKKLLEKELKIGVDTAADIADFNRWKGGTKGKLGKIKVGAESNVERFYKELSKEYPTYFPKREDNPTEQLLQIYRVAEVLADGGSLTKGDYQKQFDRMLNRALDELGIRREYKGRREKKRYGEGINFYSQVRTEDVQMWHDEVYRLEQKIKESGELKNILSVGEQRTLQKMLDREMTAHAAKKRHGPRFDLIEQQYELRMPLLELQERIVGYKNYVHSMRHKEAERAAGKEIHIKEGNEEGWTDKWLPAFYARETQERNIRDIAPNKETAERINETYFAPVHENERQRVLMVEELQDRVRAVGISTKENLKIPIEEIGKKKCSESTLVQYLGERRFDLKRMKEKSLTEEDYKAIGARLQKEGLSSWERQELEARLLNEEKWKELEAQIEAIEAQLTPEQLTRINKGIVTLQEIYKELHPSINYVLISNGMDPIGYIDGYFPHMFFDDPTDEVGKAFKALGFDLTSKELPMDIAGRTETFRPGKRWSGNLLKRTGTETDYDAIRGFDQYIEKVSDVIWHTDDIQRLRALEEHFRYSLSDEGVKERVKAIRADKNLSVEEKQTLIDKAYAENAKDHKLQNYVNNLRLYTDLLAGKKHDADRNMEKNFLGRGAYKAMNTLSNKIASNMVGANIGSALTNAIPMWQSVVNMSMDSNLRGLKEGLLQLHPKGADDLTKKSAFLATRKGSTTLYRDFWQKAGDKAFWLMEKADTFSTQTVWRSRYYDNLRNGLKEDTAIREADDYCRGLFGGRSKGAMPTIFSAKHPGIKALTMFQLEVNNQISHVLKDIPENAKGSTRKMLQAWAGIVIGGYMYNELYEKATGRRAALDPIGIANEAMGDFTGEKVRNLLEIAGDIADGGDMRLTERTEKQKPSVALANTIENIGGNVPFAGGVLFGGGRVPIQSAIPGLETAAGSILDRLAGRERDEKMKQTLIKEGSKPFFYLLPPAGGGQLRKTLQGLETMAKGGSYTQTNKGEKLQFAVDQENPLKWIQAAAFGKWATPEALEYLEKSNALGEKQTETYQALVDAGVKNIHAFDTINRIRQEEKAAKKRSLIRGSLLNGEQKAILYEDFLVDEDSADKEILETFKGTEQIGAVVDCLSWIAEYDGSVPQRSSILNSKMSDWAKEYVYLQKLVQKNNREKEQGRIDAFKNAGMKIDDFLRIRNKFSQIDDSVENDQKYATMKQWMKEQGYSQQQWYAADEAIGFWITFRLNQKKAEKTRW